MPSVPRHAPARTIIIVLPGAACIAPTCIVVAQSLADQLFCQGKIQIDQTSLEYFVEATNLPEELERLRRQYKSELGASK